MIREDYCSVCYT